MLGNKDNLPENAMNDFRKGYQGIRPDSETNQYYKPTKWCKPKGTWNNLPMTEKTDYQREFTPKHGKFKKQEKFHYDNLMVGFPEK